jgi:hypothetical protein
MLASRRWSQAPSSEINDIAARFRDTAAWGWDGVPERALLTAHDSPRIPHSVPRFVSCHDLDRLPAAIAALPDPVPRVARWSGARCDEIRRLSIDCLDAYPGRSPPDADPGR